MMRRQVWVGCFVAAVALGFVPATEAWAQPAASDGGLGEDEVTLKNGGVLRGTVVTLEPGEQVTLSVPGEAQARHIPWAQVGDVVRGKYKKKTGETPPPVTGYPVEGTQGTKPSRPAPSGGPVAPAPEAQPYEPKGPTTLLHVESDTPNTTVFQPTTRAAVYTGRATFLFEQYREVCKAPCDTEVEKSGTYYFGAPGMPQSGDFTLTKAGEKTTATVKGGDGGGIYGGWLLATFGAMGLTTGIVLAALGGVYRDDTSDLTSEGGIIELEKPLVPAGQVAGPVLIVGGAGMLAGGIALTILCQTDFELTSPPEK